MKLKLQKYTVTTEAPHFFMKYRIEKKDRLCEKRFEKKTLKEFIEELTF